MDPATAMLRHILATTAYRGGKVLRDAPEWFGDFRPAPSSRTAAQILAHIGDLFDWALTMARGQQVWHASVPLPWDREVQRFYESLGKLDAYLASGPAVGCPPEGLFQGPLADALTHFGQLAMMRRLAGIPVRGENYFKADIVTGRVGSEQSPARFEF